MSARSHRFITAHSPVEGLRRRKLPFLPVLAQAVAGVAPAGAMSVIPALVFPGLTSGTGGTNLLLTFAAAMTVMVLVAFCLRPMAKRMAAVSGVYSYTAKGLGQGTAITAGWSAMFGYGLVAMASLQLVGMYVVESLSNLGVHTADSTLLTMAVILIAAAIACFLMVRGIRVSGWFTVAMESISIGVLAVLMVFYFASSPPTASFGSVFAWNGHFEALPIGIVVAISAFVGFESPTTLGGEAHRPFISVPRAITWTPILMGVLSLFAVASQDVALKEASPAITTSSTPLSDLFSQASPVSAAVLDLGIAASWFACAIASVNALSRIFFCMGREGVAPRVIGRTHPVFQTPSMAIMVVMPVVAFVAVAVTLTTAQPERALMNLLMLGAYGYLGSYILASASLPFFLRRIGEDTFASWVLAAVTTVALGVLFCTAAALSIGTGSLQTSAYAGVILASILYAFYLRIRYPKRLATVGIYDETRDLDVFSGQPTP